ncbi:hypothetical protein E4H04_05150 [Candidatus Bathyarchaeota archaeon]|nr:MAG: hypothetical protein E4H04_05150 [Candidatus Bathyarchaeota archaeon]
MVLLLFPEDYESLESDYSDLTDLYDAAVSEIDDLEDEVTVYESNIDELIERLQNLEEDSDILSSDNERARNIAKYKTGSLTVFSESERCVNALNKQKDKAIHEKRVVF